MTKMQFDFSVVAFFFFSLRARQFKISRLHKCPAYVVITTKQECFFLKVF